MEAGAVGEVSKSLCRISPDLFSAAVPFFNHCFALENNQKTKLESQKAKSGAVCYLAVLGSKSGLAGHSFAIGTKGTHKKIKRAQGYLSAPDLRMSSCPVPAVLPSSSLSADRALCRAGYLTALGLPPNIKAGKVFC